LKKLAADAAKAEIASIIPFIAFALSIKCLVRLTGRSLEELLDDSPLEGGSDVSFCDSEDSTGVSVSFDIGIIEKGLLTDD